MLWQLKALLGVLATSLPTSTYLCFHLEAQIIANSIASSPMRPTNEPRLYVPYAASDSR